MSAKYAILGLVIEQPNDARRIAVEARRQFGFADLAGSYPYWALEMLEAEGLVLHVYEKGAPAGKHGICKQGIYEATVKGVQAFEDWLRSTPEEYSLRDDLQFRLAVAHPHHVSTIVELIRNRECVCAAREQALEHVQPVGPKERFACNIALRNVGRDSELMFWRGRIDWLREVRVMLEAISAEAGRKN